MEDLEFEVVTSREHNGLKVVEVLVKLEGAEGATTISRWFSWDESERYTVSDSGKHTAKTGAEYKADIQVRLQDEFAPKA